MSDKTQNQERVATRYEFHGVILHGAYFACTRCGQLKPAKDVGLRLYNGKVRNQPQCNNCRSSSRQSSV